MPRPRRRSALAARPRGASPAAPDGSGQGGSPPPPPRPTARALGVKTSASCGSALTRGGERASQNPFEILLEELKLRNLVPHRRQLLANQREKARTESRARPAIQRGRQRLEMTKRQTQRACPTDEAHLQHARLVVAAITRCGSARGRQHPDPFVVANRPRGQAGPLPDMAHGK